MWSWVEYFKCFGSSIFLWERVFQMYNYLKWHWAHSKRYYITVNLRIAIHEKVLNFSNVGFISHYNANEMSIDHNINFDSVGLKDVIQLPFKCWYWLKTIIIRHVIICSESNTYITL